GTHRARRPLPRRWMGSRKDAPQPARAHAALHCNAAGGTMKIAKTSLLLLAIQLALVSSIAAKYYYQRSTCPRVWTRTAAYDPELVLRGRYLSLQLDVDGCQSTLPSAKQAR